MLGRAESWQLTKVANKVAKVGDFGLARNISDDGLYIKTSCVSTGLVFLLMLEAAGNLNFYLNTTTHFSLGLHKLTS